MSALKLEQFGGMLPAWDVNLLPAGQAAYSQNGFLFSGSLIGWRKPKLLRALNNSGARSVYRVPKVSKAQARAYLAFIFNPLDGDTVTVGDLTYTFRTVLAPLPEGAGAGEAYEVLIGADVHETALHLAHALTADSGENTNAGIEYGTSTVINGDVNYFLPGSIPTPGLHDPEVGSDIVGTFVEVGATDFGASYNLIRVAESTNTERMKWLYDTLDFSHTTTTFRGGTNPSFDNTITGLATWLEFNDPDTNVIKSPVVDDIYDRYYFASPSQMPSYNTRERIEANLPAWLLGVPPPGCAPTVDVTGGGNQLRLGNTTQTGIPVPTLGNFAYLTRIFTPGATLIQDVKFNTMPNTPVDGYPTSYFAALLYDDNDGEPGTLLNVGAVTAGVVTDIANTSSFVNPTSLNAKTYYWVGLMFDMVSVNAMGGPADGSGTHRAFPVTFSNGPPQNATGLPLPSADRINMWADLITSDVQESRAYVYTWVTTYNEEGPPSPAGILTGWSNGRWDVGLWQPPPNETGVLRDITKLNLYRTVPGEGGATVFFFVKQFDIGTESFVDEIPNSTVALNDQLASTNWFPPPANMLGMTVLQNGMIAGFVGNEIWFCEPYRPHAWPPGYVLTVDFPVVGLGRTGGTLVVCTAAAPYVINGTAPNQLTQAKCAIVQPCISRASILGTDQAVLYMSPNGLIQVTGNGTAENTSDRWITRERWQQLVPQKNTRAILLASGYYCMGTVGTNGTDNSVAQQGFTIELDQDNTGFSIWPHPGGHRMGLQLLDSPVSDHDVQNVLTDPWTGTGIVVANGGIYYFDFSDQAPELKAYTWRSRSHLQNVKRNFAAIKVSFTVPPNTPAQNATRLEKAATASDWATLPEDRYGYIKTYVDINYDGRFSLVDCREIRRSGEVLRIVDGFKADRWQFEIVGRVAISNVQIGTSVKALAQV